MGDFLKANPSISRVEYLYKMSVAQTIVMSHDFTHSIYLEGEDKKKWDKYCESKGNGKDEKQARPLTRMEQEEQRVLAEIAAEKKAKEEEDQRNKNV